MKKITYWLFLLIFTISLTSLEAQEKRQTTAQEQEIEAKLQTLFGLEKEVFERRVNISAQQQSPKALKMSSNSLQRSTEIQSSHVQSGFNLQGDLSCSQEQVSNNFENGLFIEAGGQKVADDFFVSINTDTFDVNQISANILTQGGLESVNITFYEDDAGLPGTQIGASIISLVPTSQDVIGTAFGFDVHDVVLDLPSTISFAGTGTEAVRYWVQLEGNPNTAGTSVGIESTSVGVIGELSVFDNDGNATNEWLLNDGGLDSVITISGNCIQVSGCLAPENFVVSPTGENADFTWDNVPGAVDGYTLSVFEAGADPTTATAVFSANYGAGTTMATATGLSTTTPYDAYISSDCGGTISAQNTLSFSTTIEDPVCGNSYLDSGGRDNNYQDSELITTTIFPENDGDVVTLTFTFVDIEVNTTGAGTQDGCWDFLTIYNGPDTTSPVLAQTLCGEASGSGATPSVDTSNLEIGDSFTSTDMSGALTIVFTSDEVFNFGGFEAVISCDVPPVCMAPDLVLDNVTTDTAEFSWSEVANANNGYIFSVFSEGADPTTATPVYTENIPAGTLTATATGLSDTTIYDAYITADCDADGLSASDSVTFETNFPDPACGGKFYDTGGPNGDFENNEDYTTIIAPDDAGDVVTATFTFVNNTEFDVLTVDTGDGSGPQVVPEIPMGGTPISYTSFASDGSLTFQFTSSGVVENAGWEADITCDLPAACLQPLNFDVSAITDTSATFTWDEETNATNGYVLEVYSFGDSPGSGTPVYTETVASGTLTATATGLDTNSMFTAYIYSDCDTDGISETTDIEFETLITPPACDGTFSDSGGVDGNYSSSEVTTTTITPDNAGDAVTITFTYVDIETATAAGSQDGCWDFMTIYNGPDTTFPVLAQTLCGEESGDGGAPSVDTSLLSVGDAFTSTDPSGALTIVFTSDSSVEETGWLADVTCATLSVDEFSATNFTYYPNPSTGYLTINSKETIDSVEVINLLGQQLIKQKPNSQDYTLDLTTLSAGQYFLRAQIDGKTVVKSILKE